ncbi:MAG: gamma-glutamyltransferase [Bryobacteraceae bacterium]|nr:gamma-glutamyltransferase [Bryobacteraceae bacterium]
MRRLVIVVFVLAFALSRAQEVSQSGLQIEAPRPMVSQPERAPTAMVATVSEPATRAGIEILGKGGNAVDAAVAIAFALAVVHPEAGNLGGGGYMLIRMADGRTLAIDYRETAPPAAHPEMFKDRMEARVGYKASAVPGTVAGLAVAHARFGSLSWQEVLDPARRLAEHGFLVSYRMELILPLQVPVMKRFPETARIFLHGADRPLRQGEMLRQPELAATIRRLQRNGWREFYEGETARRIAADMAANGGTITLEDLKQYRAVELAPLRGTYRGYQVLTMPPSSAGGMALLEMLNILERFPMRLGMEGSAESRHLMIEAMKRAYRDRARYAGDPAFVTIPVERLTSKDYAAELAAGIRLDRATPLAELGEAPSASAEESGSTTHFSVVDKAGNIVSNTYTLNDFYGSQVIARGTGVLLNDIMSSFSTQPGSPNALAPGKRPASSMAPVILLHSDGRPWVALGSPGGMTIANTLLQVIVNLVDYRMSLRDAIEFPRIHHQFTPDRVDAEPGALPLEVAEKLRSWGHTINPRFRAQGDVHAILVEDSGWRQGWSDGRRGGRAQGM